MPALSKLTICQSIGFPIVFSEVWRTKGDRVGVAVRVLAFHQCVPGSIPALGVISGLSLLVLFSSPRGFSPGTPVFPLYSKTNI